MLMLLLPLLHSLRTLRKIFLLAFHCLFCLPLQRRSERASEKRGKMEREREWKCTFSCHRPQNVLFSPLCHTHTSSLDFQSHMFLVCSVPRDFFLSTHPSQLFIITSLYVTHMHMCCSYEVIFSLLLLLIISQERCASGFFMILIVIE